MGEQEALVKGRPAFASSAKSKRHLIRCKVTIYQEFMGIKRNHGNFVNDTKKLIENYSCDVLFRRTLHVVLYN